MLVVRVPVPTRLMLTMVPLAASATLMPPPLFSGTEVISGGNVAAAAVVKFRVVASAIPAYLLPEVSVTAVASMVILYAVLDCK